MREMLTFLWNFLMSALEVVAIAGAVCAVVFACLSVLAHIWVDPGTSELLFKLAISSGAVSAMFFMVWRFLAWVTE